MAAESSPSVTLMSPPAHYPKNDLQTRTLYLGKHEVDLLPLRRVVTSTGRLRDSVIPLSDITPDDASVLLRVKHVVLNFASDFSARRGTVPGLRFVGKIPLRHAVTSGRRTFCPKDKLFVFPYSSCWLQRHVPLCENCALVQGSDLDAYETHRRAPCERSLIYGQLLDGGLQDYIRVPSPAHALVAVPELVSVHDCCFLLDVALPFFSFCVDHLVALLRDAPRCRVLLLLGDVKRETNDCLLVLRHFRLDHSMFTFTDMRVLAARPDLEAKYTGGFQHVLVFSSAAEAFAAAVRFGAPCGGGPGVERGGRGEGEACHGKRPSIQAGFRAAASAREQAKIWGAQLEAGREESEAASQKRGTSTRIAETFNRTGVTSNQTGVTSNQTAATSNQTADTFTHPANTSLESETADRTNQNTAKPAAPGGPSPEHTLTLFRTTGRASACPSDRTLRHFRLSYKDKFLMEQLLATLAALNDRCLADFPLLLPGCTLERTQTAGSSSSLSFGGSGAESIESTDSQSLLASAGGPPVQQKAPAIVSPMSAATGLTRRHVSWLHCDRDLLLCLDESCFHGAHSGCEQTSSINAMLAARSLLERVFYTQRLACHVELNAFIF